MEKAYMEGNRQGEPLKKYLEYQQKLKEKIEEQEGRNIEKIAQEIISRGGINSRQFWKIRKSVTKQNSCDYDLMTEDGSNRPKRTQRACRKVLWGTIYCPRRQSPVQKMDQSHKKDSRISRCNPTGRTKWGTIHRKRTGQGYKNPQKRKMPRTR